MKLVSGARIFLSSSVGRVLNPSHSPNARGGTFSSMLISVIESDDGATVPRLGKTHIKLSPQSKKPKRKIFRFITQKLLMVVF